MSKIELVAPCHFGLEAVLKKEIQDLGYEIVQVEDGRITFRGEEDEGYRISRRFRNPPLSVDKSNIETAFANL